ncbi:MAG: abortive infection system antitoxin AbiGi family protein [Thermodesulfobacteriota bacterium]
MSNSSISANTLFHFTDSIDNLVEILRNEFSPHYSLENLDPVLGDDFQIALPMVCFCDIPLSQIHNHIDIYGRYALGLTKDWGKRNGINPVLYTYNGATIANHISSLAGQITSDSIGNSIDTLRDFFNFIKPYEGKLWRNGAFKNGIQFYDEREWRFVPSIDDEDGIKRYLNKEIFLDKTRKDEETQKLKSKKLSFAPNDIKYIIVDKESEIYDMAIKIEDIKMKFPLKHVKILVTRIISMEHIKDDF